jgi:uncharacterized protein YqgC (DUF456 family)
MATPDEAYGEGYKKGRKDGLVGNTAETVFGMMKDDPGGHFAAGYRDGTGGRELKPPSAQKQVRKPAADINPFDDKVAIKTVCPNCGALDWFEWKFLGRLTDAICGHSWYAGSGTYTLMQIRAAFAAGGKGAKYMTSGLSGGQGAWIGKAMGWFVGMLLGLAFRLEFGVLMIPIQAFAGLFQAKKTTSDMVARLVVLVITLGGLGIGIYEIQHASRRQFQPVIYNQPFASQAPNQAPALPQGRARRYQTALPWVPPPSYLISVTARGKYRITAALVNGASRITIPSHDIPRYAVMSFNQPHDILWLMCPQGYKPVSGSSSTSNVRVFDADVGGHIELFDNKTGNLNMTCSLR